MPFVKRLVALSVPVLGVLAVAGPARSQGAPAAPDPVAPARILGAERASGAVRIDGVLDDEAWASARPATGFVQREPQAGAPATQPTEVRVVYDDEALYVGFRMQDARPDSIVGRLARRDEDVLSDWAYVMVDSYNDNRTGFVFGVNPRGVKRDYFLFGDSNEDASWDAVWDVQTHLDEQGWTAEFRIPLSQLRFKARQGAQAWGVNFQRHVARRDETSYWSPTPPNAPGIVSSFGELAGLQGLSTPRHLELQPYTVGRVTRAPSDEGNPLFRQNETFASAGLDLKYGITSDMTLTATVNPDFGQVEADPSEVNLTQFESFFSEKRPFFVEGTDIFNFPLGMGGGGFGDEQLFYSRRIGRTPQLDATTLGSFAEAPDATRILGAVKLSGKTAGGWSVGVLNAVTAEAGARFYVDGVAKTASVEPLTNYLTARVARDLNGGSSGIGGMFTATHRDVSEEGELAFLRSAAYGFGVDGRHRFGGGNYEINGWALGSHVRGSEEAITQTQLSPARYFQRPDADYLEFDPTRTSLSGSAANVQIRKIGGGNWLWGLLGQGRTPGFEVNDLGYQRNADLLMGSGYVAYVDFTPGRIFRVWNLVGSHASTASFGGERTNTNFSVNGAFQLNNYWTGSASLTRELGALSTTALRGGAAILRPALTSASLSITTDPRRPVTGNFIAQGEMENETDGFNLTLAPSVTFRPSAGAEVMLQPILVRNRSAWQFVPSTAVDGSPHHVFAELDQTTAAMTTRLSYAFTPNLSLQFYAQPFVSAGTYSSFREVTDPRAASFVRRFGYYGDGQMTTTEMGGYNVYLVDTDADQAPNVAFADPDFNFKQLRSNLVLRWEYRPGSAFFLVWGQDRTDMLQDGAFQLGPDTETLLRSPGTNVLMLKMSYWFGL